MIVVTPDCARSIETPLWFRDTISYRSKLSRLPSFLPSARMSRSNVRCLLEHHISAASVASCLAAVSTAPVVSSSMLYLRSNGGAQKSLDVRCSIQYPSRGFFSRKRRPPIISYRYCFFEGCIDLQACRWDFNLRPLPRTDLPLPKWLDNFCLLHVNTHLRGRRITRASLSE